MTPLSQKEDSKKTPLQDIWDLAKQKFTDPFAVTVHDIKETRQFRFFGKITGETFFVRSDKFYFQVCYATEPDAFRIKHLRIWNDVRHRFQSFRMPEKKTKAQVVTFLEKRATQKDLRTGSVSSATPN